MYFCIEENRKISTFITLEFLFRVGKSNKLNRFVSLKHRLKLPEENEKVYFYNFAQSSN